MRTSDYQLQFKDNFFINRLTLTQPNLPVSRNQTKKTLCRSIWTNKIRRRKMICLKLGSSQVLFRKPFFEQDRQEEFNTKTPEITRQISITNHQPSQFAGRKITSTSSTQRNSLVKPESHFFVSRNFCPLLGSEHKDKQKILQQRVQTQVERENKRLADPRYFLKNLKIKNNTNIYKGNFTKFTKKVVNKQTQVKKRHITSDSSVSPWEVSEKYTQHCL